MKTSDQINEIAKALAVAQGQIQNPAKDTENPFFKSHYATLASGLNAIRGPLSANGICYVQAPFMDGEILMLETRLVHDSGQWISGIWPVCKFPISQQQAGSAMTYVRRYSLFDLVGIAGEDDDGNEASKTDTPAPPAKQALAKRSEAIHEAEAETRDFNEDRAAYISLALTDLENTDNYKEMREWFTREAKNRSDVGIKEGSPEYSQLHAAWIKRGKELSAKNSTKKDAA